MNNLIKSIAFVLTGPSGAGKSTYSRMLVKELGNRCSHNVTYTTRMPRKGEIISEYFEFVNISEFKQMKENGEYFCDTEFCGNFYAYKKKDLFFPLQKGRDLILDSIMPINSLRLLPAKVIIVYLSTKSNKEMLNRIKTRTPEMDKEELRLRICDFTIQRKLASQCDYVVFTDDSTDKNTVFNKILDIYKFEKGILSVYELKDMRSVLISSLPTDIPCDSEL